MPGKAKIFFIMIFIISAVICSCSGKQNGGVSYGMGSINLSGYDFNAHGYIPLDYQWEFYWKQLLVPADFATGKPEFTGYINVPGVWNGYNTGKETATGDGYATYRLAVKNLAPGEYGLKLPAMATAYRLWINDHETASNGRVATGSWMVPQQMPAVAFFKTSGEDVFITVQVSNFMSDKGGIWDKILLGTEQQIIKKRIVSIAFNLMLFGSILIMAMYHFALYFFRKKTVFTFYFGLVCSVIALRILITGEFILVYLVPEMNWSFEIKTEFVTVYAGFAFFILFLHALYSGEFSRKAVKFFIITSVVFLLITILLPVKMSAKLLPAYHVIIVAGFIYILYALIAAVKAKREGAIYILAGCLILTFVVINDILDSNAVIHTGYFFPEGLIIFIFSQSFILARIFSLSMNRVEELSYQLQVSYNRIDEYNRNLETMIDERTAELADANARLVELDRTKTDFFANVSHELRTPLTLILAPVENALSGRKPVTRDSLEMIHRNGRNLLYLINDLLDISRITAGRMTLELMECDLVETIRNCCADMEQAAGMHGISLNCRMPSVPVNVYIDENRIVRVINNLFSNSFKFTTSGGAIDVEVCSSNNSARIIFSDTGCGIPEDRIDQVFERFATVGTGAGGRCDGTGLGLSIVKDIINLHGGTVAVESRHEKQYSGNHGTVFTLEIPQGMKHLEGRNDIIFTGRSAAIRQNFSGITGDTGVVVQPHNAEMNPGSNDDLPLLLIVEDNDDLRKLLVEMLSGYYSVYAASDGAEAIKILQDVNEIDLVVSDIMMPGMDGHELLKWMRAREEYNTIPVVFLTARADHFMKIISFEHGALDYVTKPFNADELLLRIKNQMEQKKIRNALRRNYEKLLEKLGRMAGSVSRNESYSHDEMKDSAIPHEDQRMELVCSFIRDHYSEDLTRESLAAAVDLNPDTFSRYFNQYTGRTLADYINEFRVAEAKRRLAESDSPVTRISMDIGFDSIRTFNRVFKKHTGMNPGEFRESVN